MTASIEALLRELIAEVRGLRADLAGNRPQAAALRAGDRKALARIIPVVAEHFAGSRFAAWELIDAASAQDMTGKNLRLVIGKRSAYDVGKLLERGALHSFGRYRIERDGRGADGVLWKITTR